MGWVACGWSFLSCRWSLDQPSDRAGFLRFVIPNNAKESLCDGAGKKQVPAPAEADSE
jgi:hypothetical protein